MMVTTQKSRITRRDGSALEVPANMPVKLVASVDPSQLLDLGPAGNWLTRLLGRLFGGKILWDALLERSAAPDFVEDRGHTYGADLADTDKRALIEFLKTF